MGITIIIIIIITTTTTTTITTTKSRLNSGNSRYSSVQKPKISRLRYIEL